MERSGVGWRCNTGFSNMALNKLTLFGLICVTSVSACSFNSSVAPIETRQTSSNVARIHPQEIAPIYVVKPGDTLYSIAWQSRRDFRQLAQWNQIDPPYLIKYGQRIKLSAPVRAESLSSPEQSTQAVDADTGNEEFKVEELPTNQPGRNEARPSKRLRKASETQVNPVKKPATRPVLGKVKRWRWPARGRHKRVVSAKRGVDGIAIFGKYGQPVEAAAAGEVVYQGSGILGLGKLVIVKHNETYLSAYAHNSRIMVKEGEVIKQGQMIAKMGKSDADRVNLYFEIRKNGKPVNPLKVLR